MSTTWLKCAFWGTISSYAVSVVWERQEPPLLNKWFNCNPELFLMSPFLDIRYICYKMNLGVICYEKNGCDCYSNFWASAICYVLLNV